MPTLWQRLKNAIHVRSIVRSVVRRPAFVLTALAIFALSTTATTTVFTVVDAVLIRPLPYPDADRLVTVYEAKASDPGNTSLIAPARLTDWNRSNRTFELISASYGESVTDTSGSEPERLEARRVAPSFFNVFAVDTIVGRTFLPVEETFGGPAAAVLSETFWRRRYAADPATLGRSLVIGNRTYTIVGVMPASFARAIDAWLPAQAAPGLLRARNARFLHGIGRLKPGVSIEQAREDLEQVQRELAVRFPKTDEGWSAAVADLKDSKIGEHRRRLWIAFGAVCLLWFIGITNISGLVLVEARRRTRELAIRMALGSSRARVAALLFQEVLLVAIVGGLIGAAVCIWLIHYVKLTFVTLPRIAELTLDWRALLFAIGTNGTAALVCGLIPTLGAARGSFVQALSGGRGMTATTHGLQRTLVVAQVSLSVLLCASAALLARSYYNLTRVDLGVSPDRVVTFHVAARWDEDRARVGQLQQAIVGALHDLPGVDDAGLTNFLPVGGAGWRQAVAVPGLSRADSVNEITVGHRIVTVGYLRALRVPLLAGEWCPPFKMYAGAPLTAMANERFASQFSEPSVLIGQQIRFIETGRAHTIVGIVGNVAEDGPAVALSPYVYSCARPGDWPDPEYVVRAENATAVSAALRGLVRGIDRSRAVFSVRLLSDALASAIDQPRISMGLVSGFAVAAMLLAATGLYGLFALVVAETRREMAVRLALGAAPRHLAQLVWSGAGRLLGVGIVVGLALTAGAGHWLRSLLFGVDPLDTLTMLVATLTLFFISLVAIAIPALRASKVAPREALVSE